LTAKDPAPAKKSGSTRQSLPPISVADLTSKLFEEEKEEAASKKPAPSVAVSLSERTAKLFDEPEKPAEKALPSDLPTKNLEGLKSSLTSKGADKPNEGRAKNAKKAAKQGGGKVAALQGTINLNPLTMLPGAKRPKQTEEDDEAVDTKNTNGNIIEDEGRDVEDLLDSALGRSDTSDFSEFGPLGEVPGLGGPKKPPAPATLTSSGGGGGGGSLLAGELEGEGKKKKGSKKLSHAAKERPQNKGRRLPSRLSNRKRRGGKAKVVDTEEEQRKSFLSLNAPHTTAPHNTIRQ